MAYTIYLDTEELMHYGVKGRSGRKKSRFGSLVDIAKQKRRQKIIEQQKQQRLAQQNKPRSIDQMSTQELIQKTQRINAENNYREALKRQQASNAQRKSRGKKFVEYSFSRVIKPAATNVGRKYLEQYLGKKIGLNSGGKK